MDQETLEIVNLIEKSKYLSCCLRSQKIKKVWTHDFRLSVQKGGLHVSSP